MARSPDPGFGVNQSQNSSFEGSMARSPAPGFGWHPSHNSSFEGSMARSPAPGFGWNSHQNSGYWRVSFKARSQVRSWVLSLPADFNTLRRFFSCRRTEMKWKGWRGKWCDAGSKQLQPDKCWYVQNEGANLVRCSLDTPSTNMAHEDEVVPCPACALTSRLACCSWRFKACLSAFKAARRSSIPGAWAAAAAAAPSAASATAAAADDDMWPLRQTCVFCVLWAQCCLQPPNGPVAKAMPSGELPNVTIFSRCKIRRDCDKTWPVGTQKWGLPNGYKAAPAPCTRIVYTVYLFRGR